MPWKMEFCLLNKKRNPNSIAKETKKQTSSKKLENHFTTQYRLQNYFQIISKKTAKSAIIYN